MADRSISDFSPAVASQIANDDLVPIVDVSAGATTGGNRSMTITTMRSLVGSTDAAVENAVRAEDAAAAAELARDDAELARDAAFAGANVYASTAAGLAAVGEGGQFMVVVGDEIIRYEDVGGVATERARYPTAGRVQAISQSSGELVALTLPAATPSLPDIDTTAKTLTFRAGTLLHWRAQTVTLATATVIDLTSAGATTATKLYYNFAAGAFVLLASNANLTTTQAETSALVATIRQFNAAITSMSCTFPYTVDGIAEVTHGEPTLCMPPASGALPNLTSTALTFPQDSILFWRNRRLVVGAGGVSVDISAASNGGSSAIKVYRNWATAAFVTYPFSTDPPIADLDDLSIVAVVRNTAKRLSAAFDYTVDGATPGAETTGEMVAIIPPRNGTLPDIAADGSALTFAADTLFVWRTREAQLVSGATVSLSGVVSTTKKVFYDFTSNTFEVVAWNADPTFAAMSTVALVATIRTRVASPPDGDRTTMSIACPYTVDGVLFDYIGPSDKAGLTNHAVWLPSHPIRAIAHRGKSDAAPENTLAAFKAAKAAGFEIFETDVVFTFDGVPVCIHDLTVDRTTDGTGNVSSFTLAALQALDAGSWYDPAFAGEIVPSLAEVMQYAAAARMHVYLELKDTMTTSQCQTIVDVIKRGGMDGKITYISQTLVTARNIRAVAPTARVGFVVQTLSGSTITNLQSISNRRGPVFLFVNHTLVTSASVIQPYLDAGYAVEIFTLDDPAQYGTMVSRGVTGIITSGQNVNAALDTFAAAL